MIIIDFFTRNYSTLQNLLKKTLWSSLIVIFNKISKPDIDMYFDYIVKILVREVEGKDNKLISIR